MDQIDAFRAHFPTVMPVTLLTDAFGYMYRSAGTFGRASFTGSPIPNRLFVFVAKTIGIKTLLDGFKRAILEANVNGQARHYDVLWEKKSQEC
ncbi:hypothetical protein TNCV_3026571 [Trichonephila clavipes]|nr:hypothetical protein TNCV_3026571 [Trichonephila clavipes]